MLVTYYKWRFGELIIGVYKDKLAICDWRYRRLRQKLDTKIQQQLNCSFKEQKHALQQEVVQQLEAYANGTLTKFDLPLYFVGTHFQKTVWNALLQVPYGKTSSYIELAHQLNNPKAVRAVASANGANTIAIIVPCHRVIGNNGDLVGYAGGLSVKKRLLQLERPNDSLQLELF